jgi:hypothetical protein
VRDEHAPSSRLISSRRTAVESGGVAQRSAVDAVEALRTHTEQQPSTRPNKARPPVDGSSVLVDHHLRRPAGPGPAAATARMSRRRRRRTGSRCHCRHGV